MAAHPSSSTPHLPPGPVPPARRSALGSALALAGLVVVLLTLTPAGPGGWSWGAPVSELRWYLTGLTDPATLVQLGGNLLLLAPAAALAVLRWPALRRAPRLAAAALAVAGTIEVLQFLLPLDRVVSPLDAVLNATGATLAGLLVTAVLARVGRPPAPARPGRIPVGARG